MAAQVYRLSAGELQSPTVLLNGRPLALTALNRRPAMTPAAAPGGDVRLAPASIAFIVLPKAGNGSCRAD
jgi:hypothetical protein